MSLPSLDDILLARANDMASADGDVVSTLYIVAAANALSIELFAARDRALETPPVGVLVAGAAHSKEEEPKLAPEAADAVAPEAASGVDAAPAPEPAQDITEQAAAPEEAAAAPAAPKRSRSANRNAVAAPDVAADASADTIADAPAEPTPDAAADTGEQAS